MPGRAPRITDLFETPEHIPLVAQWIYDEFWVGHHEMTASRLAELFAEATDTTGFPQSWLAWDTDTPSGTVSFVENDDPARTHLRPWLAALYVQPASRSAGVGSALVRAVCARASSLGVAVLYLGTDNPGFYERLGARVHERADEKITIMAIDLG